MDLWHRLVDSCVNKLEGWKSKWLTFAGRLLMLKSMLSAFPIYSIICLKLLEKMVHVINQQMWKKISEWEK